MKRRNFILLSTIGAAAIGTSYWYLMYSDDGYYNTLHYTDVLSNIWDTETLMDIGFAYRELYKDEDDELVLTQAIASKTSKGVSNLDALTAAVKKDFETNNTLMIKGWILAKTEAQQCALFSILNSK